MRAMPKRLAACFSESKFGCPCVASMIPVYLKRRATAKGGRKEWETLVREVNQGERSGRVWLSFARSRAPA